MTTTTATPLDRATEAAVDAQAELPEWRERNMPMAQRGLELFENVPASVWVAMSLASIVASAGLYFSGRRWEAIFVGLWPPTIVNLGLFARLLRPSSE